VESRSSDYASGPGPRELEGATVARSERVFDRSRVQARSGVQASGPLMLASRASTLWADVEIRSVYLVISVAGRPLIECRGVEWRS
jgi:hypothetical protein